MAIRIGVRGLDEFERKLEDMQEGLTLRGLQHWASKIEVEAKGLTIARSSQEVAESIHVKVEEIEPKKFQIEANAKEEALLFIAEAIQNKLIEMPITSRALFKAFLDQLKKQTKIP